MLKGKKSRQDILYLNPFNTVINYGEGNQVPYKKMKSRILKN
jgi:hypothetical protein